MYAHEEMALMRAAPHTVGGKLQYAVDGQVVWAYSSKRRLWVVGTVAVAAGNNARVINEELGLDEWYPLFGLLHFVEPEQETQP